MIRKAWSLIAKESAERAGVSVATVNRRKVMPAALASVAARRRRKQLEGGSKS